MKIKIKNATSPTVEFQLHGDVARKFPFELRKCIEGENQFLYYIFDERHLIIPSEFLRNSTIEITDDSKLNEAFIELSNP